MKPLNKLEQTYYKILSGMEYSSACKLYKEENVVNSIIAENSRDCAKVAVDLAKRACFSMTNGDGRPDQEVEEDFTDFLKSEGIETEK